MINDEKVRLMTRCAIYENGKGKEEIPIAGYFKNDYIRLHTLKTVIAVILADILLVAVYIAANMDRVFKMLNQLKYKPIIMIILAVFAGMIIVFSLIAHVVYTRRFESAKKGVTEYYRDLKHLKAIYDKETDNRPTIFQEEGVTSNNDEFIDY